MFHNKHLLAEFWCWLTFCQFKSYSFFLSSSNTLFDSFDFFVKRLYLPQNRLTIAILSFNLITILLILIKSNHVWVTKHFHPQNVSSMFDCRSNILSNNCHFFHFKTDHHEFESCAMMANWLKNKSPAKNFWKSSSAWNRWKSSLVNLVILVISGHN